ncbi:hypothetical protein VM98_36770, partial [Streptomyces rubellomurinus subsp. indigoferus]
NANPGEAPKTQQRVTYLRGMVGDYLAAGTTPRLVPDAVSPRAGKVTASAQLARRVGATESSRPAGGRVVGGSAPTHNPPHPPAPHAHGAPAPQVYA